jgi:hypothetical protein
MRLRILLLSFATALLPSMMTAKNAAPVYPMTYAGGSLPWNHNKVRAVFGNGHVIFIQGERRIDLPLKSITGISYGKAYYIGVTYTADAAQAQLLMKLSHTDYAEFLTTLERMTGLKAVDTNQVPTVVHYALNSGD